jgi:putative ABC transport system ATP-binding protein
VQNKPLDEMERRLTPLVTKLGLQGLEAQFPYEISGGQKQRTAVARALITEPRPLPGGRTPRQRWTAKPAPN